MAYSTGTGYANGIPSAFRVATTENYVNTLNVHMPEVAEDFVSRYGDQSLTGLLESIGAHAPTAQRKFEHYEDDFIHQNFSVKVGVTVLQTATTITMADADSDDGTATGNFFLRVGDVVMSPLGELALCVARPATNTANLVAYNAAWTATTTSQRLIIIGNEWEEGTNQPTGITPVSNHYYNYTMIMKESFDVTGSEATNKTWFKVDDPATGQSGYLWYLKGEADTYKRFQDYMELMMLLGQSATNTGLSSFNTTEGLLPFIENKGQSMDLGSASITMADFDAIVKSLDKYRGAKEYAMYCGINLSLDIDDLLAAQGAYAAGGANYGTFQNNKNMALNLGFNSFSRGGYTFHKKTYDVFNHPKLLGADGMNYSGYGICIPMDTQKDAKSGEKIPSLRIRYKAANGYSREMEHWLTGSAVLKNKTNTEDNLKSHYRTERGFEGFAANRYMLIKKS